MDKDKTAKLLLSFILAAVLLNYPIVGLAGRSRLIWGMPQLYVYLFVVWLLIVVATALLVNRPGFRQGDAPLYEEQKDQKRKLDSEPVHHQV